MKGLVVGDYLLPTEILKKVFIGDNIEKNVHEFKTLDFPCNDRAEIRNVYRLLEEHGPSGVPFPDELPELIKDVEFVAVNICPINKEILDSAENLKVILSARGGLENIDMEEATKRGIPVIHTPNHNAMAVAEYTVGLILSETRNIARSHYALKTGEWREFYPNSAYIPELNELTVGLVGFGQNGQLLADKLKSFDCRIIVSDPFVPDDAVNARGCIPVKFEELLKEADIISLHVRLTPETSKLIDAPQFEMMKSSAYLINSARAGLVNTQALISALESKQIQGAAMDVFEQEPLPADSPLVKLDNLTLSNHRAGDTRASYWNAPNIMRGELLSYIGGGRPKMVGNPQVL